MATLPATTMISSLLLLSLLLTTAASPPSAATPYLSPTTLFTNYKTMLKNFKIFIYPTITTPPPPHIHFPSNTTTSQPPTTSLISLFHSSLLSTSFLTNNPQKAHLFFIPFPRHYSTRSLSHLISNLRSTYPYWDRTLGADHFFVCSPDDIGPSSSRNVVELKKNSIRISSFPSLPGHFIPHKDISFPPLYPANPHAPPLLPSENKNKSSDHRSYLGYLRWDEKKLQKVAAESNLLTLISQLKDHPNNFLIETEPSSDTYNIDKLKRSKFCLFVYEVDQVMMAGLGEAMLHGCVPVFITSDDRPIQDLPFMDVLKWRDLALFVGTRVGIKDLLVGFPEENYEKMRKLGVIASKHFIWNINPKPFDAFHMLMYQLWNRRFVIRYARY